MRAVDLIDRKRHGEALAEAEVVWLVEAFLQGHVADYQMAAFLMAVVWQGLSGNEIAALTAVMVASGTTVDLSGVGNPVIDKHSTGGVGDKTTLVVAPLVASFGVPVIKLCGRGLGHTGGTIDKLAAIPGMRTQLSIAEIVETGRGAGIAVASASSTIVPADKRIYALRDATATVGSIGLIVASIMSKKLALTSAAIVLDVKVGRGGLFDTATEAREFARQAIALGRHFGRPVHAVLSRMDRPLGRSIGNALEVAEAVGTLGGTGPGDLIEVSVAIAAEMLVAAKVFSDSAAARPAIHDRLASGAALPFFDRWIESQGANPAFTVRDLPRSSRSIPVIAPRSGTITAVNAREIGRLAMRLGAGRATVEDSIDPGAGIVLDRTVGETIAAGELIATICTSRIGDDAPWRRALLTAVEIGDQPVTPRSAVVEVVV